MLLITNFFKKLKKNSLLNFSDIKTVASKYIKSLSMYKKLIILFIILLTPYVFYKLYLSVPKIIMGVHIGLFRFLSKLKLFLSRLFPPAAMCEGGEGNESSGSLGPTTENRTTSLDNNDGGSENINSSKSHTNNLNFTFNKGEEVKVGQENNKPKPLINNVWLRSGYRSTMSWSGASGPSSDTGVTPCKKIVYKPREYRVNSVIEGRTRIPSGISTTHPLVDSCVPNTYQSLQPRENPTRILSNINPTNPLGVIDSYQSPGPIENFPSSENSGISPTHPLVESSAPNTYQLLQPRENPTEILSNINPTNPLVGLGVIDSYQLSGPIEKFPVTTSSDKTPLINEFTNLTVTLEPTKLIQSNKPTLSTKKKEEKQLIINLLLKNAPKRSRKKK